MRHSSAALLGAAAVEAGEAAIVLAASVISGIDAATGQSYQLSSGIALTVIGVGCAAALAVVAVGLGRVRAWSRTPAVLTQIFVGILGIELLGADRLAWGVPSVLLAVAGFVLIFIPPSVRALAGQRRAGPGTAPSQRQPPAR